MTSGSVVDMAVTPNGKYKTGTCDVTVPFRHTNGTLQLQNGRHSGQSGRSCRL